MRTDINFSSRSVMTSEGIGSDSVPNSPLSRIFDVTLILMAFPFILLFFLIISVSILLDSKGGVFYGQNRIGLGGRKFKALKFRTMVLDADKILQRYLDRCSIDSTSPLPIPKIPAHSLSATTSLMMTTFISTLPTVQVSDEVLLRVE